MTIHLRGGEAVIAAQDEVDQDRLNKNNESNLESTPEEAKNINLACDLVNSDFAEISPAKSPLISPENITMVAPETIGGANGMYRPYYDDIRISRTENFD